MYICKKEIWAYYSSIIRYKNFNGYIELLFIIHVYEKKNLEIINVRCALYASVLHSFVSSYTHSFFIYTLRLFLTLVDQSNVRCGTSTHFGIKVTTLLFCSFVVNGCCEKGELVTYEAGDSRTSIHLLHNNITSKNDKSEREIEWSGLRDSVHLPGPNCMFSTRLNSSLPTN